MNETTIYGTTHSGTIKAETLGIGNIDPRLGVKFPLFDKDNPAKGIFIKTKGFELLKSVVRQFVKTERGERVMLPNFGLSLRRFLFEPITPDLVLNMENEIYGGFAQYLPEVRILSLLVGAGENVQGFGIPGLKVTLVITSINSNEQAEISVNL
jgi:phage baseplate assembly protein W